MGLRRDAVVAGLAAGACFLTALPSRCEEATAQASKGAKVAACQDPEGGSYSEGAVVLVRGKLMRCVIGPHWAPLVVTSADPTPEALDATGENPLEAAILWALRGPSLPALECEAVLNSDQKPAELVRVSPGEKRLLVFWTPTCGPCKPLLAQLAALAESRPQKLSIVGIVQAADPELDPPGEWRLLRVKGLMAQYKVGFPTCVHSSNQLAERWQARGVPLTLLVSQEGVERVAAGGTNGHRLIEQLAGRWHDSR